MEEQQLPHDPNRPKLPPINPPAIKMSLMIAGMSIAYTLIVYLAHQYTNNALAWGNYVLVLAGLFLATKNFRDQDSGGFLSFGRAFSFCFRIILFSTIIVSIYSFIHFKFIAPEVITEIADKAEAQMLDNPRGMSDDQIAQALKYQKMFMNPTFFAVFSFIGSLFVGTILSLIVAAIMKKDNVNQIPAA